VHENSHQVFMVLKPPALDYEHCLITSNGYSPLI
jgi:hypothetical protein